MQVDRFIQWIVILRVTSPDISASWQHLIARWSAEPFTDDDCVFSSTRACRKAGMQLILFGPPCFLYAHLGSVAFFWISVLINKADSR